MTKWDMTKWDTIAIRAGLTFSYIHEGDDSTTRAHFSLAGFDDHGRPFEVDLHGWTTWAMREADAPLNQVFRLMNRHLDGDDKYFCPVCEATIEPATVEATR